MDPQQVLSRLNFGRVDAETDDRLENCFIGTELLRQVLMPQHSLLVGGKGSGKSAMFRLLSEDINKIKPLLPKGYEEILCIPAHGLQSDESLVGSEFSELHPKTVDDFRYYWLLYIGIKTASTLVNDEKMKSLVSKSKSDRLRTAFLSLEKIVDDLGLKGQSTSGGLKQRFETWIKTASSSQSANGPEIGSALTISFRQKTGISIISLLDLADTVLQETNCLSWILLDKLDLLFISDIDKLKMAITGLVQLLIEYSSRFKNIQWKIFLRSDIYRQLRIVNKSHLVSYTTEMKWRDPLLLKLLVSRAVSNQTVREYCEEKLGTKVDVSSIIIGNDAFVLKVFYTIFDANTTSHKSNLEESQSTHTWILKRLIDGLGTSFPRELIHLGNLAVGYQREMNRLAGKHLSNSLISIRALKKAFADVSNYRCDTYLYSEFPHLAKHFDVFRGSDSASFHREELYMLFEPLSIKGDDAIRAVHDAGLLMPIGRNIDSTDKFKIPLLYKTGLGVFERRNRKKKNQIPRFSSLPAASVNLFQGNVTENIANTI
jgi:hypothetical protein